MVFNVEAKIINLDRVIEFVMNGLNDTNFSNEIKNEFCIAVEEIFINIVNYAYEKSDGYVLISVIIKDTISIRFEDSGCPYNPLEQSEPDLNKPINERQIGGLGIHIAKNLIDNMEYLRINDKNILKISKNNC